MRTVSAFPKGDPPMRITRRLLLLALPLGLTLGAGKALAGPVTSDRLFEIITNQNGARVDGPVSFRLPEAPPDQTEPETFQVPELTVDFREPNGSISDRFNFQHFFVSVVSDSNKPGDRKSVV